MAEEKVDAVEATVEVKMIDIPAEFNGRKYLFQFQEGTPFAEIKEVLSQLRDEVAYGHKIEVMRQDALKKQADKEAKEKEEAAPEPAA